MAKKLFIAEKPSVARQFSDALKENMKQGDGFLESENTVVTWCVGHLVSMSYPDKYDPALERWSLDTIPFIPDEYKYEVIGNVSKQFNIVKRLLNREDVDCIYICTDSGREGEYIYRLVDAMAGVHDKQRKRVWIDSQTDEEILRGIKEAKDWSEYDALSDAAYLRAKEDYLMGINFSRALTLKYSYSIKQYLGLNKCVLAVGRVMTCVLGIIVSREREIRAFNKTPFYRIIGQFELNGHSFEGEWKAVEGSHYFESPRLYKENGFKKREDAEGLINALKAPAMNPNTGSMEMRPCILESLEKKKETKNPTLLYNLAELQNDCSKYFKISPNDTLAIAQELYEKKLTTYPRTDARVLSTAVAKEIYKNINGLKGYGLCASFASEILEKGMYKGIEKTRYVNDKQITDHYAIIPTGQGLSALASLNPTSVKVYEMIVRRLLSIFYPAAVYQKFSLVSKIAGERFFSNFKVLESEGYLKVAEYSFKKDKSADKANDKNVEKADANAQTKLTEGNSSKADSDTDKENDKEGEEDVSADTGLLEELKRVKPGETIKVNDFVLKEGETSPPKRYTSGSMILTMENAGQFIEDEELRSQIKGSGIGTSATRAGIIDKLDKIGYIKLNKKTQILTPTLLGEIVYDVVDNSIKSLLNPSLTASWEKGLTMVADKEISDEEYMKKLSDYITKWTNQVKQIRNQNAMYSFYDRSKAFYKK
ncbi:MAG: DNA topoisomerase [Lachnospiraceae bacterium]|nr:DNA topoisomerase [Lachnospiraceae bacterium]